MEKDIKESHYLEHGEYDGNLYGTKIDSIHEVVDAGRTCILDVNPQVGRRSKLLLLLCFPSFAYLGFDVMFSAQALKVLKTAEFMPFVVFIAAPELDTLRAMHKAVIDAGLTTKLLTVGLTRAFHYPLVVVSISLMGRTSFYHRRMI